MIPAQVRQSLANGVLMNSRYLDDTALLDARRSDFTSLMRASRAGHEEVVKLLNAAKAGSDLELDMPFRKSSIAVRLSRLQPSGWYESFVCVARPNFVRGSNRQKEEHDINDSETACEKMNEALGTRQFHKIGVEFLYRQELHNQKHEKEFPSHNRNCRSDRSNDPRRRFVHLLGSEANRGADKNTHAPRNPADFVLGDDDNDAPDDGTSSTTETGCQDRSHWTTP